MENQVSYSTVDLYVEEVILLTPTEEETVGSRIRRGFSENLQNVGTALTNLFVMLIPYSPVIILCLALLVIVWWAVKIQANRNKTDIQEEGQEKEERNVQAQERRTTTG